MASTLRETDIDTQVFLEEIGHLLDAGETIGTICRRLDVTASAAAMRLRRARPMLYTRWERLARAAGIDL